MDVNIAYSSSGGSMRMCHLGLNHWYHSILYSEFRFFFFRTNVLLAFVSIFHLLSCSEFHFCLILCLHTSAALGFDTGPSPSYTTNSGFRWGFGSELFLVF